MTLPAQISDDYALPAPVLGLADEDPDAAARRTDQLEDIVRLASDATLPGAVRARLVAALSTFDPDRP